MPIFKELSLLALYACLTPAQSLSTCPTPANTVTTSNGYQYQICQNTDYQVWSSTVVGSINSVNACLQLCSTAAGCSKAVYDHIYSYCHLKGNPTNPTWVTSTQYDTIQYIGQVTDGSGITACPSTETTINNADGSTSIICPMSDYQAPSINIINSVADVATCAGLCHSSNGCVKAVFDHVSNVCHIKGTAPVTWVVNLSRYDAIRIVSAQTTTPSTATTSTQGLAACPTNASTFTTDDGSLYETCPQTDCVGPSTKIIPNVYSDWDCLEICNIAGCPRVVFDTVNNVCHIKDPSAVWGKSTTQFDTIRFIKKTTKAAVKYQGLGSWSNVTVMPVIPVAAYVVPQQPVSNRILMFSSYAPDDFYGPTGMTQFADYNFQTGAVSARAITNTQHDMFCPGISSLQDGRIVITGGQNAQVTSYYDPVSNNFVRGPDMKLPRGYQSSTTTSSGKVFTVGGSFSGGIGGKVGEVLDPVANQWTLLPGADVTPILTTDAAGAWRTDNHAWLFGWKDGSVFQAGPSKQQHWFGTTGNGSVTAAGVRDPNNDAMCGINVMYDALAGKIFSTGGSQDYTDSPALSRAYITTIGAPFTNANVEQVSDALNPRGFGNGVVLPDGTILLSGGQKKSLVFTDIDSIMAPELFDPVAKTFKQLAPAAIPRNYHSVSLLLADGTVFTGGGGMCYSAASQSDASCNRAADHPSVEVFSPPYLFNADGSLATRPAISAVSTTSSTAGLDVSVGGTITVTMSSSATTTFSLVRMGSVTHSTNTDQRRVPLTSVVAKGAKFTIKLPSDSGILIPGYYYLFAMSNTGVPSVARTIQVHL